MELLFGNLFYMKKVFKSEYLKAFKKYESNNNKKENKQSKKKYKYKNFIFFHIVDKILKNRKTKNIIIKINDIYTYNFNILFIFLICFLPMSFSQEKKVRYINLFSEITLAKIRGDTAIPINPKILVIFPIINDSSLIINCPFNS